MALLEEEEETHVCAGCTLKESKECRVAEVLEAGMCLAEEPVLELSIHWGSGEG